jgi:hypothetical protein
MCYFYAAENVYKIYEDIVDDSEDPNRDYAKQRDSQLASLDTVNSHEFHEDDLDSRLKPENRDTIFLGETKIQTEKDSTVSGAYSGG